MRIHILSDLHLEFAPFQPDRVDAGVVVLAGDVHTGTNGIKWILQTFRDRRVIYVLGNHEFYGQKIQKLIAKIKEIAQGTNVHVLENDRVEIGDTIFLGATLWTDFCLYGDSTVSEILAQNEMNDFRRIRTLPGYRRFRPVDAKRFHSRSREWLRNELESAHGRKIVVVTHHAPSPRSISPELRNDPLNPAFASNLESFISQSGAALWIHGHIHRHSDYTIGSTRVIANPRGYPEEPNAGFDSTLVVTI